jgi:hypothetical protein
MPHGALKPACDALDQLAVESRTVCPTPAPQKDRDANASNAQDTRAQSSN